MRGGIHNISPPTKAYYALAIVLNYLSNQGVYAEDFGRVYSNTENGSRNSDEVYIITSFSAFLAFCILSVVACIAYFSILEDRLMKKYLDEGEVVQGVVVSAEFARGGGASWRNTESDARAAADFKEYVIFVEYNRPIAQGCYMTKVRKQVKAREEDVTWKQNHLTKCYSNEAAPLDTPIQVQRMLQMFHDEEEEGKNDMGIGSIEMLVLPHFYKSGVSRQQVERANGSRHRLSTLALIVSGLGLSAFCVRLAAKAISSNQMGDMEASDTNLVTLYMGLIFGALVIVEMLFVHCCLQKIFVDALEDEYLKSGDLVPTDEDDSSISTCSDFFVVSQAIKAQALHLSGAPPCNPPQSQTSTGCPIIDHVPSSVM